MLTQKNHTEINHIDTQRIWLNWTTISVIVVSFTHMFFSISAFSAKEWYEQFAAMLITGAIDLVTWRVSEYLVYERSKGKQPSTWSCGLFVFALIVSFILNWTYLIHHMPEEILGYYVAVLFSVLLAAFVPAVIGIIPTISAKLERDKVDLEDIALESAGIITEQKIDKVELINRLLDTFGNDTPDYKIALVIGGNRKKAIDIIKEQKGIRVVQSENKDGITEE